MGKKELLTLIAGIVFDIAVYVVSEMLEPETGRHLKALLIMVQPAILGLIVYFYDQRQKERFAELHEDNRRVRALFNVDG